jgi:hypothetical protein
LTEKYYYLALPVEVLAGSSSYDLLENGTGRKGVYIRCFGGEEKYAATMHMVSIGDADLLGNVVRGVA